MESKQTPDCNPRFPRHFCYLSRELALGLSLLDPGQHVIRSNWLFLFCFFSRLRGWERARQGFKGCNKWRFCVWQKVMWTVGPVGKVKFPQNGLNIYSVLSVTEDRQATCHFPVNRPRRHDAWKFGNQFAFWNTMVHLWDSLLSSFRFLVFSSHPLVLPFVVMSFSLFVFICSFLIWKGNNTFPATIARS